MKELELEQADIVIEKVKAFLDDLPDTDTIKLKALASIARYYTFGKGMSDEAVADALQASINTFDPNEQAWREKRGPTSTDVFDSLMQEFDSYVFKFFIRKVRALEDGLALLAIMYIKVINNLPNAMAFFDSSVLSMRKKLEEWQNENKQG